MNINNINNIFKGISLENGTSSKYNTNSSNTDESIFSNFERTGDPDNDLSSYASAFGISEDEAKEILSAMFGDPEKPDNTNS